MVEPAVRSAWPLDSDSHSHPHSHSHSAPAPAPAIQNLGALTWPDVAARSSSTIVAVPVGSTEQHGPHLPLSTDTEIATALARGLAARRADTVVAPAVPYGSSGEHAGFPGTLSIGQQALETLLVELIRSADAFAGAVVVSAHGGNAEPLGRAAARLSDEGRRVRTWSPPANDPTDSHAGVTETSLLLALRPEAVRRDRARPGVRRPLREIWPALRHGGMVAVSANGVLGDPTGATAAAGRRLLTAWVDDLARSLEGWP
jgi:mycofactocin precursor peptide peptidase